MPPLLESMTPVFARAKQPGHLGGCSPFATTWPLPIGFSENSGRDYGGRCPVELKSPTTSPCSAACRIPAWTVALWTCRSSPVPHTPWCAFNFISVDQFIAAKKIGHLTRFPSLTLGVNGRLAGAAYRGPMPAC